MPYKEGKLTFGQRAADTVSAGMGSWAFIITQSTLLILWVGYNVILKHNFDPYPFILLNLMLSMQAAYTGPIVMMSANRQSQIDRMNLNEDLDVDIHSNKMLQEVLNKLREMEDRLPPKEEHITINVNTHD